MKTVRVAIAGATGAVGVEMLKTLEKRDFPVASLKLLASARSVGKTFSFRGATVAVEEMTHDSFKDVDLALFSAGSDISREYRPYVVDSGALMVDNSSAFRMEDAVPLVVPEVNPEDIDLHHGVIANPNCTTAIMLTAVAPLHRAAGLKRIVASTYQAASGAGAKGMAELSAQISALAAGQTPEVRFFAYQLANNIIPHIDSFADNGYTKEELKMLNESRKMLHLPGLRVSCTCVRIPVPRAHSESLNLEFEREITPDEVRDILRAAPGVDLVDDPAAKLYPMPKDASERYNVLAGRIRQDISRDDRRGIDMFVSGDQLLKGAALNAVQIAEVALQRGRL